MDDHGLDPHNEKMVSVFQEWATRLHEKTLTHELEHIPDMVALMACLQHAAVRVKLRKDLITPQMAIQLFTNLLDEISGNASA